MKCVECMWLMKHLISKLICSKYAFFFKRIRPIKQNWSGCRFIHTADEILVSSYRTNHSVIGGKKKSLFTTIGARRLCLLMFVVIVNCSCDDNQYQKVNLFTAHMNWFCIEMHGVVLSFLLEFQTDFICPRSKVNYWFHIFNAM